MTKFHLVMDGKAKTYTFCLVILSEAEGPAFRTASIRKKAGAPSSRWETWRNASFSKLGGKSLAGVRSFN
jgi:hypothetical protein